MLDFKLVFRGEDLKFKLFFILFDAQRNVLFPEAVCAFVKSFLDPDRLFTALFERDLVGLLSVRFIKIFFDGFVS